MEPISIIQGLITLVSVVGGVFSFFRAKTHKRRALAGARVLEAVVEGVNDFQSHINKDHYVHDEYKSAGGMFNVKRVIERRARVAGVNDGLHTFVKAHEATLYEQE